MGIAYKQKEMMAYKTIIQLEQLLKKQQTIDASGLLENLSVLEQRLHTRKFRLAVVGEFNRGKSSFINVLLGKRILPEDVLATTATINRVTYGEKPKAYLTLKDHSETSEEISVEDLASFVTKMTAESSKKASEIYEAVVEYPTMLCYNDVDLIDTPGMNDEDEMNSITINRLENIDLAIVAINAMYPYSETENRFVVKLLESSNICQIIFVVTYIDLIREREREKLFQYLTSRITGNVLAELKRTHHDDDGIFQKYHSIFDNIHIFGVSSRDAMEALETKNMTLYEKSGFLRLNNELPEIILKGRTVNLTDNIAAVLKGNIDECRKAFQKAEKDEAEWQCITIDTSDQARSIRLKMLEAIDYPTICSRVDEMLDSIRKKCIRVFLDVLGEIRDPSDEAIRKVVQPAMQSLYRDINKTLKRVITDSIEQYAKKTWQTMLDDYARETVALISRNTRFFSMLRKEGFNGVPFAGIDFKSALEAEYNSGENIIYYWVESPVQAVISTNVNESVLIRLNDVMEKSIAECRSASERFMQNTVEKILLELTDRSNEMILVMKTAVEKLHENRRRDLEILNELTELESQCREIQCMYE